MNDFSRSQQVEARSRVILSPFLQERAHDGQLVFIDKGPLAKSLQQSIGDAVMNDKNGIFRSVEIKAEAENRSGNFFLETWSNRNLRDRRSHAERGSNPGWMLKLKCDFLFYHFVEPDELYVIDFFKLKKWAFEDGNIFNFEEKLQGKYTQRNDTWGRCVPITTVAQEVGVRFFRPLEMQKLEAA